MLRSAARLAIYLAIGIALWYFVMESGVHATISGVLLALVVPSTAKADGPASRPKPASPALRLEHLLHPWVIYGIMPLFALANSGIHIGTIISQGLRGDDAAIGLGIILGLVVGKPLGVFVFSYLAVRSRVAHLPQGVTWAQLLGVACLAGIGFTMSLFISSLAFSEAERRLVAIGAVLIASLLAAVLGVLLLRRCAPAAAPALQA